MSPTPVPRFDAETIVRALNHHLGVDLKVIGWASTGEVSAAFVQWPDGREGVLTHAWEHPVALERTADILRRGRAHGIPSPLYQLMHELEDVGTIIIQERLPGTPQRTIDVRLIDAMLDINDRLSGLLAERPDVPELELYLDRSGPGFCLHESLARYDQRTRRLLDWIHKGGRQSTEQTTGTDLVHADFHPGNVLVDEVDRVSGVVDWDGARRGDLRFGLVTLAFDLCWGKRFSSRYSSLSIESIERVSERLDAMDDELLRPYWAHMSLRLVDWSIRHHSAEVVDHYIQYASSRFNFE